MEVEAAIELAHDLDETGMLCVRLHRVGSLGICYACSSGLITLCKLCTTGKKNAKSACQIFADVLTFKSLHNARDADLKNKVCIKYVSKYERNE